MTTATNVEKLVYSIFDRSNWIVQQVKLQTDSYLQNLASNLLIEGINPPPWFLNPNSHSISSHPHELNKEELISELLLPRARPDFPYSTGQCYLQSRLITGDNVVSLDRLPNDIHDSNNGLGQRDEPRPVHETYDYDVAYNSNCVPRQSCTSSNDKKDVRVPSNPMKSGPSHGGSQMSHQVVLQSSGKITDGGFEPVDLPSNHDADYRYILNSVPKCSPVDQNVVSISDLNIASDQSIVKFQRSKSRQKALELRTSAKATKSRFSQENETIPYSGVTLYGLDLEEPDHSKDLLVMANSYDTNKKSSVEGVSSRDLTSKSGTRNNCGRITRSKSKRKQQSSVSEPLKLDVSHESVRKDGGNRSCVKRRAKGIDHGMGIGAGGDCGQTARSNSSFIQHICLNETLETGRSSVIQYENGDEPFHSVDYDSLLVSKEREVVIPFHASKETSDLRDASMEKCKVKEEESRKYLEIAKRSVGSSRQSSSLDDSVGDAEGLGAASAIPKVGNSNCGGSSDKLNPRLDKGYEVLEVVTTSSELVGNMKKSNQKWHDEGLVSSVKFSSIADHKVAQSGSFATEQYPLVSALKMTDGHSHKNLLDSPLVSSSIMPDGSGNIDLSDSKIIPSVTRASAISNEERVPFAMDIELEGHLPCFRSNLHMVNSRTESGGLSVRLESVAHNAVQPKQLDFNVLEGYNMIEQYNPPSVIKCPEQSSRRTYSNLLEPEVSTEKSKSDSSSNVSSKEQLMGKSGASKGKTKGQRLFVRNVEDCSNIERTSQSYLNENLKLNQAADDSKASSYICHSPNKKDNSPSDLRKSSYLDVHQPSCNVMERCPEQRADEECCCSERWTRNDIVPQTSRLEFSGSPAVPCVTELATEDPKSCLDKDENMKNKPENVLGARQCYRVDDENNLLQHKHTFGCEDRDNLVGAKINVSCTVGDPQDEDNTFSSPGFGETQPTYTTFMSKNRSGHTKADSWPQFKRKMIKDQQTNCLSASPSFRVQRLHNFPVEHICSHPKTIEDGFDASTKLPAFPSREQNPSESFELFHKMECHLIDGTSSSPMLKRQQVEGVFGIEEQIKVLETPSTSEHEELGPCLVSSLSKEATEDAHASFVEDYTTSYSARDIPAASNTCEKHKFQNIFHVGNVDDLADVDIVTSTRSGLIDGDSYRKEGSAVKSPCNKELAFNQNLLVNEGFVLNEHSDDGELDTDRDENDFCELNATCTSIHRASILEQICRTASMCTPLSHFSCTHEPLKNEDLFMSLPNGLLEHTDITSTLPFYADAGNQTRATSTDEVDSALRGMLYSDCLPYSGARYGWNSKNSDTPPAGKYCERIPSKSLSSEKRLGSNPELTCFPIEEDPIVDEDDDSIQEDIGFTKITSCASGEASLETEKALPNPPASESQTEEFHNIGALRSTNAEVLSSVKQRLRNNCSDKKSKKWGNENQSSSTGSKSIEKFNESLQNRFSKENLSSKSIQRGSQRPAEKVKRNNIVSNVTSFIPLVQQKKAAAVCKGKRDIKVKALEAAEAARLREEKKANERKIKKEALKLERAKIEQETLRQRDLDKRKKEEELKKKDADIAARKRLREEEGRKEKEWKRKRIGVERQTHRAQEEKVIAGKAEKGKKTGNKDKNKNSRKESCNQIGINENVHIPSGYGNTLKKLESQTEFKKTGCNILQDSIVSENSETLSDCEICSSRKLTSMLNQLPLRSGVATATIHEKSYEMSPYQPSDDEEEDEFAPKKFIPSWASKNCVALVLCSQQQIDPSLTFPRESFCCIDEALEQWKYGAKAN